MVRLAKRRVLVVIEGDVAQRVCAGGGGCHRCFSKIVFWMPRGPGLWYPERQRGRLSRPLRKARILPFRSGCSNCVALGAVFGAVFDSTRLRGRLPGR